MAHAERCPVCYGKGKLPDESMGNSTVPIEKTCHGCGGLGWVTVGSDVSCPEINFDTSPQV